MAVTRKPDFSGWATKNNVLCTDGRTILPGAFKHQDKSKVQLVWEHNTSEPGNIIGHAILHDRAFGVFTEGYLNKTSRASDAKELIRHGDITQLSISANRLRHQAGGGVSYGNITEVSLVMHGANKEAVITDINLEHSADGDIVSTEAIITTGLSLKHSDDNEGDDMAEEIDNGEETVQDIIDGMSEEQQNVLYYMVGVAAGEDPEGDDEDDEDEDDEDLDHGDELTGDEILEHIDNTIKEGFDEIMARNTFEVNGARTEDNHARLSHSQFAEIVAQARDGKKESLVEELRHSAADLLQHNENGVDGVDYGIANLSYLFPDAKALEATPEFISRRMDWVDVVLKETKHIPFSHVKTIHADITEPEARARGYIKGKRKKEEVFKLLKRTTGPTTIYKKQRLDRDDILDITDFNVVVWLQQEMRLMLEEEIARAILVGDGRNELDDDKVEDPAGAVQGRGIRSILHDDELYAHPVELASNTSPKQMIKGFIRNRTHLKGTGKPIMFISDSALTDMMLEEDNNGRALYETEQALTDKLRVSKIVTAEIFDEYEGLVAIFVNLADYAVGTNQGGGITNYDNFDLNFNQHIYLSETRLSGGLTKAKSALVVTLKKGTEVIPSAPGFSDNTITIPSKTGVEYYIKDALVTGSVTITEDTDVIARAADGYFIPTGSTKSWSYTYTSV